MDKYWIKKSHILKNNQKEILLQRRAKTKEIEPNKWAWHGDHVKVLESNINAIIREVKEELGLTLTKKRKIIKALEEIINI